MIAQSVAAYGSDLRWRAEFLDKNTREIRQFALTDEELKIPVPGRVHCSVGKLKMDKSNTLGYWEVRTIYCDAPGGIISYVRVVCNTSSDGAKVQDRQFLSVIDAGYEYSISVECI